MADFSALKTSIQNYIKQNGNEEITGNLLQQILLSMVSTLGDSAINDLVTALNAEIANRGNADTTLQGNIDNEATARGNADTELGGRITTLQGVVNGIKANVENGYVYAGIATPSTTPVSGKVFYLALTAGTYTNFGSTVVPQGINILKYNGSAWSLDTFVGLDDAPTQGSNNLVKSGGVLDSIIKDGSAFDLSAYNSGTTYADLSAALTALNALPAAYKKSGMSFKYVQTYDNKYVQWRCMAQNFTTDVTQWQGVDEEPIICSKNLVRGGGIIKQQLKYFKNRFDKNSPSIVDGKYRSYVNGDIGTNALFSYIMLPVDAGNTYTVSGGGDTHYHIGFYSNDVFISGVYDVTFTVPSGCNIISFSFRTANKETIQLELGASATEYVAYGVITENIQISEEALSDFIDNEPVLDSKKLITSGAIVEQQLKYFKNKFDKNSPSIVDGFYISYTIGNITPNELYSYIILPVKPGETYTVSGSSVRPLHIAFFYNDVFVSGVYATTFTIPSDCDAVSVSFETADKNTLQIELGDEATSYVPYGVISANIYYPNATEPFRSNKGLLYSKLFNLDTDTSEYNNIDGTNNKVTNEGLLLSSNGNRVTLDRYYSLSNRTVEYLCKFDSSSVAVFTTDNAAPIITIDMNNKKFSILKGSVIDEVNLDAGIESHLFKLQITKHYQVQSATLIDITVNKSYTVSKEQDGEGGAGAGSLNPTPTIIGMQYDKYRFYAASGQFYIKNIKVVCNVNNVKLLMYGDSITEPEAYYPKENFAASWTQLVISQINGTAVSSGRGSTNIDAILARISNELPYINAKYVMVTIGTNGGNTLAKLRQLVDYIKSCGAIPILNNIPCNDNNGTSNTAENNAMIQQVRTEKGIKGCLFNIATSEDGDGETLDYSTMYEEEYPNVGTWYHHPNPKGAEAMFLRTMIDVPKIYD